MFNKKNIKKIVLKNIIISLIFILFSFVSIYYLKKEITNITNKIELNNKIINDLQKRTDSFSLIKEDANIIALNEEIIDSAFLPSDDISAFINKLDEIADKQNINQKYRFESPVSFIEINDLSFSSVNYLNTITADMKSLIDYLVSFEKIPYFAKVESINISSRNKLGIKAESTINMRVNLLTKTIK